MPFWPNPAFFTAYPVLPCGGIRSPTSYRIQLCETRNYLGDAVLFHRILGPANMAVNVPFTSVGVMLILPEYIVARSQDYSKNQTLFTYRKSELFILNLAFPLPQVSHILVFTAWHRC